MFITFTVSNFNMIGEILSVHYVFVSKRYSFFNSRFFLRVYEGFAQDFTNKLVLFKVKISEFLFVLVYLWK